jgi:hypothetical protein
MSVTLGLSSEGYVTEKMSQPPLCQCGDRMQACDDPDWKWVCQHTDRNGDVYHTLKTGYVGNGEVSETATE